MGWYTAAEGGVEVKIGAEIGSNYTVYARWTHIAHTGGTATCQKRAVCAVCAVCGYVIQPQLTHTHIFDQEKAEEAEGVRQRSCQNDPQHIDRQNIPKLPARPVGPKPAEKPQETPGSGFVDVPEESYFREAVDWAVKNGITTGVDAAHFAPDGICTRGQIVTFIWRSRGSAA